MNHSLSYPSSVVPVTPNHGATVAIRHRLRREQEDDPAA